MIKEWTKFSPEEIERRRLESLNAMDERRRDEFNKWYQKYCDRLYWTRGKCCAGCDHWNSLGGETGQCDAAGLVSGNQVMRSIGATFTSYVPEPGFPFTRANFYCGKFSDEFDWSTLDKEYLSSIGAIRHGELRAKPDTVATDAARDGK